MGWQGSASGPGPGSRQEERTPWEQEGGVTEPCFLSRELSPREGTGLAGRSEEQRGLTDLWKHHGRAPAAMRLSCACSLGFQGLKGSTPASEEVLRAGESLFPASQPEDGRDGNTS